MSRATAPRAWQRLVDGHLLPREVDGHPAIEFCNTRAGWGEKAREAVEYLEHYDDLLTFAAAVSALDSSSVHTLRRSAERRPADAESVVAQARQVRRDLYDVLTGGGSAAAFERLSGAVRQARATHTFVPDDHNFARWQAGVSRSDLGAPLNALLLSAELLLTQTPRSDLHRCPGNGCGWLFRDTSGRRRWCIMAVCGNRAKQASYQRRRTDD